jgi:parallel beta-helix repeat protein
MKIKNKSQILVGILTMGAILGFFALIVGTTYAREIITIYPSGGDDTANIQSAFDSAGPRTTIRLAAGQFYTNAIFVENFYGTLKGAGKDLTKIDVLRGLDPGQPGISTTLGSTHIFTFSGGNVHISDLSFDITPYEPAEPWGPPPPDGWWYDLLSAILITGDINSRIEKIKFSGHEGTILYDDPNHPLFLVKSYNVRVGVEYGGGLTVTGRQIIRKCEFDSLWLGITAYGLMNCDLTISSNVIEGGAIGIINADNSNSKFQIFGNDIEANAYAGIWVMQFATPPCQWFITGNNIKPSILADGILLEDYTGSGALKAVVSHNKIILDYTYGGIWTYGVKRAFISGNFISGTGGYGIALAFTDNCLILSNHISNYLYNGITLLGSNRNLILGNCLINNGGWGLWVPNSPLAVESNHNRIVGNIFHNNDLGNIFDECNNKYKWNLEW